MADLTPEERERIFREELAKRSRTSSWGADVKGGPDWWLASDGRWYPPESKPGPPVPPQPPAPAASTKKKGCLRLALLGGLLIVGLLMLAAVFSSGDEGPERGDRYGAFDVCTQVVKERLRAPATAKFPNPYEEDGEVRVSSDFDKRWTVRSHVDAENGFGANIRTDWTCVVDHTERDRYDLVSLNMDED